ncbi:receptor-type tyrosine- phosphatase T-like, partial [Paramuricea clavata]
KKRIKKSVSAAKIMNNTETNGGNCNEEVEYDNYVPSQYVAMDDLGADDGHYAAMEDPGADDRDTDSETDAAGENADNAEMIYGNAKVTDTRDPFRMVPAEEFESYVRDMKKNENFGFDQQFKELPQGICYPCTIAKSPENKPKNRYGNIVS